MGNTLFIRHSLLLLGQLLNDSAALNITQKLDSNKEVLFDPKEKAQIIIFLIDVINYGTTLQNLRGHVDLTEGGNVKCLNKKLNYCPQKSNTSLFGLELFRWLGPKIWVLIPDDLKNIKTLPSFKSRLKKFNIDNCPCKLCKDYIHGLGYIN